MKIMSAAVFLFSLILVSFGATTTTTSTAPSAPTGVAASCGPNKITVSWTAVSDATSYKVYRSAISTSGTGGTLLSNPTASTYDDTTGTFATAYYYNVTALNANGESAASTAAGETFRNLIGGTTQGKSLALAGNVTLFAGSAGYSGMIDGAATTAKFDLPQGITTDNTSLYVADYLNNNIRKVDIATGTVSTLAGSASGSSGSADGTGNAASFLRPYDITNDGANLYVTDFNNRTIRKIVIATGVVTTLAGTVGASGNADGIGTAATFAGPKGITISKDNATLFVTDGYIIRKIVIATKTVSTFAGTVSGVGHVDGIGTAASFNRLEGITTDGTNLYAVDAYYSDIRKILISSATVSSFAGAGTAIGGNVDGIGTLAKFNQPIGITTDGTNLYVTEYTNQQIRKVVISSATVSTLAGSAGTSGTTNGTGTVALFSSPHGITVDCGALYVAEYGNGDIRKIQ